MSPIDRAKSMMTKADKFLGLEKIIDGIFEVISFFIDNFFQLFTIAIVILIFYLLYLNMKGGV